MKIERISSYEIDWDELDRFPDRMVSQTKGWMAYLVDAHRVEPVFARLTKDGNTVGYFTGTLVRKFGIPILGSPFVGQATPYMGFNLLPGISRQEALHALEDFAFRKLGCFHIDIVDRHLKAEEALAAGFSVREAGCVLSDLSKSEDDIFRSFTHECRRMCRLQERFGVIIEEAAPDGFAEEYYEQAKEAYARHGLKPTFSLATAAKLIENVHPTGNMLLTRARDAEGRSLATAITVGYNRHSFLWGSASRREFARLHPNEPLHWFILRYWKRRGVQWHDWGGTDWDGGSYKKKYGVQPETKLYFSKSRNALVKVARVGAYRGYYLSRGLRSSVARLVGDATRRALLSRSSQAKRSGGDR